MKSSCPCTDCVAPTSHWDPVTSPDKTTPAVALGSTTYQQRAFDAEDTCRAKIISSSFTRIAAKESSPARIGYEYFGSQDGGNYVQWPGMQDCNDYDPRFRDWYAAAASGPKDVVLVQQPMSLPLLLGPALHASSS